MDKIYRRLELFPKYLEYRINWEVNYLTIWKPTLQIHYPTLLGFGYWLYINYHDEKLWYQKNTWSKMY